MWGSCWYELIYLMAAVGVAFVFAVIVTYNLAFYEYKLMRKMSALGFTAMVILGIGFFASELLINQFFNEYSCNPEEATATILMLISVAIIILIYITTRNRDNIFGPKTDSILMLLFSAVVLTGLYSIISEKDGFESLLFLLFGPIEIIFRLVN